MRVVVSAYACVPGAGSEEYVGHNWVRQIARFHDVTVFTDARNRNAIEDYPYPTNVRFEFVEVLSSSIRVGREFRDWRGREWGAYARFLMRTYARGRRLWRESRIDLSHLVTWASFRWPFLLAFLPSPSILGPVGGGELYPPGFPRTRYERAREVFTRLTRYDPILLGSLCRSGIILAANRGTAAAFPPSVRRKVRLMQNGVNPAEFDHDRRNRARGEFVILWVGLLIKRKALDLLVGAMPAIREGLGDRFQVVVCGDGPERARLEQMATELGVLDRMEFRGWASRREVLGAYQEADVLCFTSLRETTGIAVLEAMAAGLPVVCLRHAGQGEIVTSSCGVSIVPTSPRQVTAELAAALVRLGSDADLREALGAGARQRIVEEYDWDVLGERMRALYDEVAG